MPGRLWNPNKLWEGSLLLVGNADASRSCTAGRALPPRMLRGEAQKDEALQHLPSSLQDPCLRFCLPPSPLPLKCPHRHSPSNHCSRCRLMCVLVLCRAQDQSFNYPGYWQLCHLYHVAFKVQVTLGIDLQPADGQRENLDMEHIKSVQICYGYTCLQRRLGNMAYLGLRKTGTWVGCSTSSVCHTYFPANVNTPNSLEFTLPHIFSYAGLCIF